MKLTRRTVLGSFGAGAIAGGKDALAAAPASCEQATSVLRPAVHAAGRGIVKFRVVGYEAL